MKELKSDCFIVLGGPHATAFALSSMKKWNVIDAIVLGEGELTFVDLIQILKNKDDSIVPGTLMRDRKGEVVEGKQWELIEELDDLPLAAYDLYSPIPGEELFIEVGRHCPFQCTFCSTSPF